MSSTMIFTDLDRTIVYSPSALMLADAAHTVRRLLCVELYRGKPLSFITEQAARLLADLSRAGVLVPATSRTVEQFQRIALPGPDVQLALCANGGRLLRNGVEDLDFSATVAERLSTSSAPVGEILAELSRASTWAGNHPFIEMVRDASGLFCYAVVDRVHMPGQWVDDLSAFAAERAWGVSVQGRKVYCVPRALSKAAAVREIADALGVKRVLAAGDSILDAEMLAEADAAIRPAHGELGDSNWRHPTVSVTESRGVLAGEEIVTWLAREALA